jgi:hypothetical protein
MAFANIRTAAGTVVSASTTAPATEDGTGYAALTWTAVGEVTDAGNIGGQWGEATHTPLSSRIVQALKTTFDAGTQDLQVAIDKDDTGQELLRTAFMSDNLISVKIALPTGEAVYYRALVMSNPINIGSADGIVSSTISLRINSYPVVV